MHISNAFFITKQKCCWRGTFTSSFPSPFKYTKFHSHKKVLYPIQHYLFIHIEIKHSSQTKISYFQILWRDSFLWNYQWGQGFLFFDFRSNSKKSIRKIYLIFMYNYRLRSRQYKRIFNCFNLYFKSIKLFNLINRGRV